MNFMQRLGRYMVGLFMGTLLALFFFGQRSCTQWLPNVQVREFLGEPGLMGDERTRCLIQCGAVTMEDLRSVLEDGDIEYSRSDVRDEQGSGKFYRISKEHQSAEFVVTDSTTTVRSLEWDAPLEGCECGG